MPDALQAGSLSLSSIASALREGAQVMRANLAVSVAYAAIFALIGLAVALALGGHMAPLIITVSGGFMLIGPALLAGYFRVARLHRAGRSASMRDLLSGFREASAQVWALALVCALLLLIWLTDAGILYSFMVGGEKISVFDIPLAQLLAQRVGNYLGWSTLMGAVLAFIIFAISAFSVPLLCARRAGLVRAVSASVRAVFANFGVVMVWAVLISTLTIGSILVLPLFLVVFPLLAYASDAIYRRAFPEDSPATN